MDHFNDVVTTFLSLEHSVEGQKALGLHQKYLNLCSEAEQRSYGFGKTRGQVKTEF